MHKGKISIVVPVYNVEKYLPKCIESLIGQTYSNLEIILVDDDSKDNSGKICDEYGQKDLRIKVIHKENGGISSARNAALDICTGEYIGFIDSDDWAERDMYENMYNLINENNIVCCGYNRIYEDSVVENKLPFKEFDKITFIKSLLEKEIQVHLGRKINEIGNYVNNKLFPARCFKEIRFPESMCFEDIYMCLELILQVEKVVILPKCEYNYLARADSIVGRADKKKMYDLIQANRKQESDMAEYPTLLEKCRMITCANCLSLYSLHKRKSFILSDSELLQLKEMILQRADKIPFEFKYKIILFKVFLFLYGRSIYDYLLKAKHDDSF